MLALCAVLSMKMALSNIGVNIGALLGTLGIVGIAFALAAQDTVKNVFGAFTILTDKSFNIGDTIRVGNIEGTVIDVGVRSTKSWTTINISSLSLIIKLQMLLS